ncbi:MAG TPA: DNA polymerase IV [Casimicrobiaceae bacterium]|nr:DNA polymerase IV [Casimicrobiaceae bacterium]
MSASTQHLIAHLDMDAFYASVELLRYPDLRGKAVVIGGGSRHAPREAIDPASGTVTRTYTRLRGYVGRGVITTATYEARALGLHSAMGLMKAAALAPDAILLPTDFEQYRRYSRMFKAAVRTIATEIEDRGIDEIYIDLTGIAPPQDHASLREPDPDAWQQARRVAQAIKQSVHVATGLTCSIAVAPNKLLAKIASDLDKPNGLTLLRHEDVERRIWPLPARRINGVGPKSAARLEGLGIRTIGELAAAERDWLIEHFGAAHGAWMHDAAHGRDDRPVVTDSEPKSISRELTFERDLHPQRDREALTRIFEELCDGVAGDLARKRYVGRTVGIKLRYDNFKTVTRDLTIERATQDGVRIRAAARECLKRVALDRRIRLLGVRMGSLTSIDEAVEPPAAQETATPSLFDQSETTPR